MALAAGPKVRGNLKPLPPKDEPIRWIENATGELYGWQRDILHDLTAGKRPRVFYAQVPRKNGKTRLAALLGLLEICLKRQRHVYAISDSERNLNSVLMREIRDLINGSDLLRDSLWVFKDKIECPETDSFIQVRPGNFKATQGINPHLVLADEIHLLAGEVLDGMQMSCAARDDGMLFGISTPGYDLTSRAHEWYEQVRAGTLAGKIYEGDPTLPLDDRTNWRRANPCIDRPGFEEALAFDIGRLPEHEGKRFRLGIWTATESAWLPYGKWASLAAKQSDPPDGTKIWLGFDGSFSGDSTALVGITDEAHIFVVGCWENPGKKDWRVPRLDVNEAVEIAMARWNVQELVADPPYWESDLAQWDAKYPGKVVAVPTYSRARFAPCCTGFYAAVMDGKVTHDGDPRLARHMANAMVQPSPQGDVIVKADKDSPAKIDLAVAAVLAHSRASISVPSKQHPLAIF